MDQHPIKKLNMLPSNLEMGEPEPNRGYLGMTASGQLKTRVNGGEEVSYTPALLGAWENVLFVDSGADETVSGWGVKTFATVADAFAAGGNDDTIVVLPGFHNQGGTDIYVLYESPHNLYLMDATVTDNTFHIDSSIASSSLYVRGFGRIETNDKSTFVVSNNGYLSIEGNITVKAHAFPIPEVAAVVIDSTSSFVAFDCQLQGSGMAHALRATDSFVNVFLYRVGFDGKISSDEACVLKAYFCNQVRLVYFVTLDPLNTSNMNNDYIPLIPSTAIADLPTPTVVLSGQTAMTTDGGTGGIPAMMGCNGSAWVVVWE